MTMTTTSATNFSKASNDGGGASTAKTPVVKTGSFGKPKQKSRGNDKSFDESLTEAPVEEHLLIRFPQSLANTFQPLIKSRQESLSEQIELTFKDARHGKLQVNNKNYYTTLVDLPCITESLKTIDNKQFYKIADISQMIIVHERRNLSGTGLSKKTDFNWPDGVSPVLADIVEDVECEIERLLTSDHGSMDVKYEVLERKELDSDDSQSDARSSNAGSDNPDDDLGLDAAIDEALGGEEEGDEIEEEESDDDDDASDESGENQSDGEGDDKNEENELKIAANVLRHEILALKVKLREKEKLRENQVNAIMKERFGGIVEKLARELELKEEQLETLLEEINNQDD